MDRQVSGDELWREKFLETDLSEAFQFVGRDWTSYHGKKAFVKCKACDCVFATWGVDEFFKGRQKHLLCIKCGNSSDGNECFARSPKADEAMVFYLEGHSIKETAEKFDATEAQINNAIKARGLSNSEQRAAAISERKKNDVIDRLSMRLLNIGFDYVSGYESRNSRVKIRCRTCGTEIMRTVLFLCRNAPVCHTCRQAKAEVQKKRQKELGELQRELERRFNPRLSKNHYDKMHNAYLCRTGICEICGNPYTARQYVESCGLKYARDNGVCSAKCRDEKSRRIIRNLHRGRRDSHRHRARAHGCEYDGSITLAKLIQRDGLTCAICGRECDLSDHTWSKYSGPLYPSIDHIIPMSKGGGHTWDNVQVAHIICNSMKGDHLEEVGV